MFLKIFPKERLKANDNTASTIQELRDACKQKKWLLAPDLNAIREGLTNADVKFIMVGGLAAVVPGAPVTTMDVDIVHHRSPENIVKLLSFLKSIEAIHRFPNAIEFMNRGTALPLRKGLSSRHYYNKKREILLS